ncbi:MAG: hypothetical protein H7Y33_12070 [Cytophagales bacterium]|nr:hypothetical protein [Rhizobacter sp.]
MTFTHHPWRALAALALTVGLTVSCGGVDSGGTGQTVQTSSSGRISGFGSVIVNGVRFDDAQAAIVDDEGLARVRADLKLGMVVDVEGEVHGNSGNGVARRIQFGNEIAGPVQAVDTAASRLTVLGQVVQVDVDTLFSGYNRGLADAVAGDLVEVFAFYDTNTAVYMATRIERKTSLASFKLRGRISGLSNTSFALGGALIDYSSIAPPALPRLANGLSVRVSLQTLPVAGRWVATSVHTSQRNFPDTSDAELEGFIGSFVSAASFQVGGVLVDASGPGVDFRHGSINQLANGTRVEVEGQIRNGVLVARQVDFKRGGGGDQEFELHGAIESVNATARSFVLRGVTVAYDTGTAFSGGTAANLVVGAQLEAKGAPSPGGAGLQASRIKFER